MKILLDDAPGLNLISAYEPGRITILGQHYQPGLVIYPRALDTDWPVGGFGDLSAAALASIVARKPELLILGTGERQQFPDLPVLLPLVSAGIGYEIMDNRAACRTFNILLGEGREAALILLK